jgi:hypothetical protein
MKWKSIGGFDSYEVSSAGTIRRIKDRSGNPIDRSMARTLNPNGYFKVILQQEGKGSTRYVHDLVARAFHGDPVGDKNQVNHKDGNKKNNSDENLEWMTRSENMHHAYDTGLAGRKVSKF